MDRDRFEDLKLTGQLPSPSSAALRVLLLTQDENVSLDNMIEVIQSDPALTGRLIQLAASAVHGSAVEITGVKEAAVRIGLRNVFNIAMTFSLVSGNRRGRCPAFDYDRYWTHSLANAVAAQEISESLKLSLPEEAFTLGMLANIGSLALASAHPDVYASILGQVQSGAPSSLIDLEQKHFHMDHREVGAALLEEWNLPARFSDALLHHAGNNVVHEDSAVTEMLQVLVGATAMANVCVSGESKRVARWGLLKRAGRIMGADSDQMHAIFDALLPKWASWNEMLDLPLKQVCGSAELEGRAQEAKVHKAEIERLRKPDGLRILAVDDDPVSLRLLVLRLRKDGHSVLVARDGREALALYLEEGAQMIIADWSMPHMDGLQLCNMIRSSKEGQKLYFLLLTGHGEEDRIVEAFDAGVDDYMVKGADGIPFKPELLRARIKPAVRVIRLQEANDRQAQDREQLNRQLDAEKRKFQQAAMTDALTGMPNRRAAMRRMDREWANSRRSGKNFALISLDIDHFKLVNDGHGHDVGDEVLRATANAIHASLRRGDTCARMGGEEFLMICPSANTEEGAMIVAERVREAVEANQVHFGGYDSGVTVSMGVALRSESMQTICDMLKVADEALYLAKGRGRNCAVMGYSPGDSRRSA